MKKKRPHDPGKKQSKEEVKRRKFEQNQSKAKPYLLVTSSAFWFEIFKRKPHLYQLHYFLLKVKRIRRGGSELIDIIFDKLYAIQEQNFELAAALRNKERQMEEAFMQKHKINKLDVKYAMVKNGKINLGVFYIRKHSKKNKYLDATQNGEVQKFLQRIHKDDVVRMDIYDIQPLFEKYKSVTYKQLNINDFKSYSELKRFVNHVLKEDLRIWAVCLHINDLTVNEISMQGIGEIIDIVSYLNSTAAMIWGYDRKRPLKDFSDQVEISMLLFSDAR